MKKLISLSLLQLALLHAQPPARVYPLDPAGLPANSSHVIVRFRAGTSFLPGSGASHALGADNVHVVNNPPGLSVADTMARYRANPNVVYVEPDYLLHTTTTPTDPMWSTQWDMVKINAPGAWNTQTNASDVIVAVIDTGVDFTHPDLQPNLWVNPADGSHGFTCINGVCAHGGQDDYGHGTHVAGTIGASANNSTGIAGINWRTQILACKFLDSTGSGNDSDAVLCFNQILALRQQGFNIRVTSNSWGGGGFSQALKDAMSAVESAGVLNVCAAGNSGANADITPMYPGGYDNRGIVSVLASDQNDWGASFTNYGLASVDIAAPGVSTMSTVPSGTCALCDPSGYRSLSGTSMATPHVSAVAVAMFHLNPSLTANQARDVLLDPASYDLLTDSLGSMTSTGGRLNFQKVIANPLLTSPKLNNFPTVTAISNVFATAGSTVSMAASASDPDNDPLRMVWSSPNFNSLGLFGWMAGSIFPAASGNSVSFQAPVLGRTAVGAYVLSVADGRGGSATTQAYATIQPSSNAGGPPSGSLTVSPASGPVGTTVTVNFPVNDPAGAATAWEFWVTGNGGSGFCCQTASSYSLPFNAAGVYRVTAQAIDGQLTLSTRPTAVVRIGGATGTPPIASATFDKLSGPAPLTVNIDLTGSSDPDGTIQSYTTTCQWGISQYALSGARTSCMYDTPGTYRMMLQVVDNAGLIDVLPVYVVVTPANSGSSKAPATVTLSNLSQTYTGAALMPTATTNPAGLAIVWTNAPQTAAGTYAVTATVSDPNYQGSATATFTINKAVASVTLLNMTQTYTGAPLTPGGTTAPAGLAIAWTNAPDTMPGHYAITAAINDPNYTGSANGTFTINPAPGSTPPVAAIASPANGATVTIKSSVNIQANVTVGSNPVSRLDFLVNGAVACSDTTVPYSCSWTVPGAQGKTYQLQAKAYDTTGQVGSSSVVTVTSSR